MRWREQVVGLTAVLQTEDVVAVFFPTARRLIRFLGQQCREVDFLRADRVHLFAHNVLDLVQDLEAQRQPRVDARCCAADVARADQQLVACELSFSWVVAQRAEEER